MNMLSWATFEVNPLKRPNTDTDRAADKHQRCEQSCRSTLTAVFAETNQTKVQKRAYRSNDDVWRITRDLGGMRQQRRSQ